MTFIDLFDHHPKISAATMVVLAAIGWGAVGAVAWHAIDVLGWELADRVDTSDGGSAM